MPAGLTFASSTSPTIQTNTSAAHPTSSPRIGRLRSLTYLRSYSNLASNRPVPDPDVPRLTRDRYTYTTPSSRRTAAQREDSVGQSASSTTNSPGIRSRVASRRHRIAAIGTSQTPTAGWLPFVSGSTASTGPPAEDWLSGSPDSTTMPRNRSATTPEGASPAGASTIALPTVIHANDWSSLRHPLRRTTTTSPNIRAPLPVSQLPSIRFVPFQEPRSPRPSLNFAITTRILPSATSVIRVGRYSEKDAAPPPGAADSVSDAPIGFKSKVVSRRHCEFFYQDNHWYIKDVKSSSGTFLNHIRLSPPGEESRPFAIKDGDLVQLGIDFKGGEEMIFRCVKIHILCNRGWQMGPNKFNKSAHKHLNDLQKANGKTGSDVSGASTECTICLNSIAPCQSLFVAPCSHTWHYKCIRPLLDASRRRQTLADESHFVCPNCRNVADLNADVDDPILWEDSDGFEMSAEDEHAVENTDLTQPDHSPAPQNRHKDDPVAARVSGISLNENSDLSSASRNSSSRRLNASASDFVPSQSQAAPAVNGLNHADHATSFTNHTIASREHGSDNTRSLLSELVDSSVPVAIQIPAPRNRTPSNNFSPDQDGPLTPRNYAGPFVFDGAASARVRRTSWAIAHVSGTVAEQDGGETDPLAAAAS